MGRFDNGSLDKWSGPSKNPASPEGMKQGARAGKGYESGGGRFADSSLGKWTSGEGFTDAAQTWYTGRNLDGTNNGWDTDFWNRAMAQNKEFGEQGKLATQFEQADATGVVTWDHTSSDGRHSYQFGDIYDGGKKVGNVFTDYDKDTANLMMADILFAGNEKARIFSDSDPMAKLATAVTEKREYNNTAIPKAMQAADFNADVKERQESFQDGNVDEAITAGGAAGGALTGAGVGAVVAGPLGAVVGGGIGAIAGGLGAWANEDALTEQAARAYEITSMSNRENGTAAGIATGVQQWAGFGGKLITPLSNLTQGGYDLARGEQGDGTSEFYRLNDKGETTVPKWVKVADVAASIGDGALQFASPLGVAAYTTQMTGVIGGEVAELALTGGKTFDYNRGGFDSIFSDDDGNFDASAAAAGIGKIGIDAVQLGMVRGLAGKADATRLAVGEKAAYGVGRVLSRDRLPRLLGGRNAAEKEALAAGGKQVEAAGFRFIQGADGNVVDGTRRATLSLLAPSEQLGSLSARVLGARAAAKRGGALTADDFYRAANAMATGERKVTTALVNGMGEGYEEAVQAVLEPHSHGNGLDMDEIGQAALYGFAGGVGMGLGMAARMPSADEKMFAQAQMAELMRFGASTLTKSQWKGMDETAKRAAAALNDIEMSTARAAYAKMAADQAQEINAGVVGANKVVDAIEAERTKALAKASVRTDGAFVITQIEDPNAMPADAVGASALQTLRNINDHVRGAAVQTQYLTKQLEEAQANLAATPGDPDAGARVDALTRQIAQAQETEKWGRAVLDSLDDAVSRMYAETATPASIEAETEVVNQILRDMFHERIDTFEGQALTPEQKRSMARAVSLRYTRDPQDQAGSYPILVPQISAALTVEKADNLLQISHAVLPSISGDFDGDKIRQLNQLVLDDADWINLRSGAAYLGAGESVNIAPMKYEKEQIELLSKALKSNNVTMANFASGTLTTIGDEIRNRYDGIIDARTVDMVLGRFNEAVHAGTKDARAELLDGLQREAGGQITEMARGNLSNEWMWIDQLLRSSLDGFQRSYAAHRPSPAAAPNTSRVSPKQQSQEVAERRQVHAANLGSTVGNLLAGDQPFRQSQKLHYSSLVAAVLSAENAGSREQLQALAQLYEALGQNLATSELEAVRGKDEITARVYARLQRVALEASKLNPQLNGVEALAAIANLRIADIDIEADGSVKANGREITLTQYLLKQSVAQDRREKDAIFDLSPELQAKHARLMSMTKPPTQGVKGSSKVNAERAFVEVVGSQQMFTLLGDEASVFGPHLTVEQFVRYYVSLSELDRRDLDIKLKGEAAYLGREEHHNMPYDLGEVSRGEVSAFRAVVDSVIAVGHDRITIDAHGKLHGELAKRSDRTGEDIRTAHAQIRQALFEFAGLSKRKDGELSVEMLQRLLSSRPDIARQVMGLIPNAAVNAVFQIKGNDVFISNWVYEMFVMKDAKAAEMHYWRNLLLAEWNAAGVDARFNEEEADEGQKGRDFGKLKRRMHRVMWRLAAADDGGQLLDKFVRTMESATSLEEFIGWVNTTPGVRGEQAPLTAWVDDVAEFDMDKAQGGWTTVLAGSELREAISSLRKGSEALVKDLAEEKASFNADAATRAAIRRVIRSQRGAKVTLDPGDQALYDAFVKSIDEAGELKMGLGPQAMIYQTIGAAYGFYPQAHTKGKNPPNVELAGMFDALRDAFDYTTNYERVMAALTSTNLDAVSNNLSQVAKDGGRTMDDEGREVSWEKPSPEQMLDMLENPDTRAMARAVLFPQAMERDFDGALRPKLLVGKSLKDLLDGTSHRDVFPKAGVLKHEAALRYVSMVEAQSRAESGKNHFSLQRVANDIVIARLSAADHVLSMAEIEQMALDAYYEIAQVLQATGSIASKPGSTDELLELKKLAKEAQRDRANAGRIALASTEGREMSELVLDELIAERAMQAEQEKQTLILASANTQDPAEKQRLAQQALNIDETQRLFAEKMTMLRSDDMVGLVVSKFGYSTTDPQHAEQSKRNIVEYIGTHLSVLERSSSSLITLGKLTEQLQDSGRNNTMPDLTDKEWAELSNAVIAVYIDEIASVSGGSVAPFPGLDEAGELVDDTRYYDPSFSYLADELLDPNSPLVRAAAKVHQLAGRQAQSALGTEVLELLGQTVYKDFGLGQWTSDIPRASIEANQRLNSAAAAAAIAMAGNSPKRQAVISAATRRTFEVPGDELLSTVTLNPIHLDSDVWDEVTVNLPGGPASRPLAQLNNRFARSVTLTYTDATGTQQTVDLLAQAPNLGRPWVRNEAAKASGLQEVHLDRIQQAVDHLATDLGFDPIGASVEMAFFHPDSQPEGPEWFNNLFFEGTSFKMDGDQAESLNTTLWFSAGGINQSTQRAALDASKLGKPALEVVDVPSSLDRESIEQDWGIDLTAVLREKARLMLTSNLGFGKLDPEFYNAAYKDMKLRHFVRGEVDGNPVLWSAEQVIAFQQANPGQPLPIDGAMLWIPSDDVLRSMLGEQGTQGVARIFDDALEIDLSKVPTYRGVTDTMVERFAQGVAGETAALADTRVSARARQQVIEIRGRIDDKTKSAYDVRMKFLAEVKQDVFAARAAWSGGRGVGGFDATGNLAAALSRADKMLRAENIAFDWMSGGAPFIGPRKHTDSSISTMLLHELEAALVSDGYRTGWIYREGSDAKEPAGLISEVSLSTKDRALRIAPGDLVVVELDSFNGDMDLAKKRLQYLADKGAIIVLGSGDSTTDLRAPMSEYLEVLDYERIAGSGHVYQPLDMTTRYQNQRAKASILTEVRGVSPRNHVAVFLAEALGIEENAAWVNADNPRLSSIAVSLNLVPTDFLAGFNVPVRQIANPDQIDAVRRHLRGLKDADGRAHLHNQAHGNLTGDEREKADIELKGAIDRLLQRFDDSDGTVLPEPGDEFGTGDIIPLVDSRGRVLLYRHGMQAPTRDQVDAMMAQELPGKLDAANVAIFPSKVEPAATTHRGEVVRFKPRAGYGLSVELQIPLQVFGDKKVLEWNGMKYLLTPRPKSIGLPDHGFFENWGIDLIASAHDTVSKESFDGVVNSHRDAFAYFGIDFTADVAKFFGINEGQAEELLKSIATRTDRISVASADELMSTTAMPESYVDLISDLIAATTGGSRSWADLIDEQSVEAQITRALLIYLSTPGAKVSHVLKSGGFNDTSTSIDAQSILMPRLFTQAFDNAPLGSELRTEINRRLNEQIHNPNTDGTGYTLRQDFKLEIRHADPANNKVGWLQFAEAHSSGDNPIKNGMSFDAEGPQAVSQHSAAIASQSIGAVTAFTRDLAKARLFKSGEGVTRFERDKVDGGAWRMLNGINLDSAKRWRAQTPAEAMRRNTAREAVVQFRQPIRTLDEYGWNTTQRKDYHDKAVQIVEHLGLDASQAGLVDFWVRQGLGRPEGLTESGEEVGFVTGKAALEAANDIWWSIERGYLPIIAGEVPALHLSDLQAIYRASKGKKNGWAPRESMDANSAKADTWDEWVKVSLGTMNTSENLFDPLYLLALDGFMHSYQNATRDLLDLPVSKDPLKTMEMLDETTNRMLVSLDPNQDLLARERMLVDVQSASLDDIIGGQRIAGKLAAKTAPASEVAKRRAQIRKWRRENDIPMPVDVTMKNFRKTGGEFIHHSTNTNVLSRMLINMRVGTALLNPALYVSMGPEQWMRGGLDRAANLLTGQGTTGLTAQAMAKAGVSRYTPEQLKKLGRLYQTLGQRNDFKAMIFHDLMFLRPHAPGIGKIEKWLEGYAKLGSRMQDPTWGMRQTTMARRYLEAALQHILATPTLNTLTVDRLIAELSVNPEFLKDKYPDAHRAATNSIAQLRSLKSTPLSLMLRGVYEPLSESSNSAVNMFGNVVLKMPLLFSGYAMNVATTITGMQGLSDMVAMAAEGRKKGPNSFFGRIQAKLRGDVFDPERDAEFDMSSVIEGIDLTRSFIRGGITHTGLFMLGMMGSGLGLSGEDDETKKRRRLAELQGAGFIYDPRAIENDFRNADAIFLDWLPFGMDSYFQVTPGEDGRSMAQLHWMLKQFVSPIMGFERFYETGDFRNVTWGFQDALGSFPLINTLMWDDAVETAHEFAKMADEEQKVGGPTNMVAAAGFLTNGVGVYERMLFENAFVNQLYTSLDRYDRDPYKLPLRDSDGDIQRDIEGNPRPNDVSLEKYVDPETGEILAGYQSRDTLSGTLHALTENRASMAFVMSMFTGLGDSDYLRKNMAVKTRKIEKPEITQAEAEAFVQAAIAGEGGQTLLDASELAQIWKNQAKANGVFVDWGKVDAQAEEYIRRVAAGEKVDESWAPANPLGPIELSTIDKDEREVLTHLGARAVMDGLVKGTVKPGDASLAGIFITREMREKIQTEWMEDLIQDGIDLGLDRTKATSRMKRLWYGPTTDPSIKGIGDILWDRNISDQPSVEYKQLNTTYVMGPDGRPWATGFTRDGLMGALGLKPVKRAYVSEQDGMGNDERLNSTDLVNGLNTGLRALELKDPTSNLPTDKELADMIVKAIEDAANKDYEPFSPYKSSGGGGGYGGRGYGRRGGGGYGGGGGGYAQFQRMYALPGSTTPYANDIPFINTSNPLIRRGDVRRERVWSERGRLKQWQ